MGGKSKAPAPDPNIGLAANKQAELGEDWLEFAREQFSVANERQQGTDALTKQVIEQQLATQDQANRWAREDRARYEDKFRPIEDQFIEDATSWDSAERQAKLAGEARATVQQNAAQQRQAGQRNLAAMGVDPRSGRFAGIDRSAETATALGAAGAENRARDVSRTQGMALRADAANMGRGLPSQAAGAAGLGLSAGGAALGGNASANAQFMGNTQLMGQGFQGAMSGYGNQANTLNAQYGNQLNAWGMQTQADASSFGGLMSGLGTLAGFAMFSSKKAKENKEPVPEGKSLDAIKNMPIEKWDYKAGMGDGGTHVGTYAEDFKAQTGKGNGKSIPIIDAIGVTMGAIKDLDRKVDKIARSVH